MSLKSLSLALLVSIFSMNSYAVVLDCHRKADAKKTSVGAFYYEGTKPTLHLDSPLFDSYGWQAIPVGVYKVDTIDEIKAAVACRDSDEPQVQMIETRLESGIALEISVTCFDDPSVVTKNFDVVCK